jgi:hypothetical protein
MTLVAAVAGRLLGPDGVGTRFPRRAVARVDADLERLFQRDKPFALIASAARGADLLALKNARLLGIRCRIVLPFAVEHFRRTSVGEHPEWARLFDGAIADAESRSDLVIIGPPPEGASAYVAVSERILAEAHALAARAVDGKVLAVVIWDGHRKGPSDQSAHFRDRAVESGCIVEDVLTSSPID